MIALTFAVLGAVLFVAREEAAEILSSTLHRLWKK